MEINRVDSSFPIRPARHVDLSPPAHAPRPRSSRSSQARLRDQLRPVPSVRAERVADLRRRIQDGSYDEAQAMDGASLRILGDLE